MRKSDVVVIGAGLLGCFAARELRRFALSVTLLESREDVCTGISRANTAMIYPGYDHKPGTRKAEMTVRANASFDALCAELEVPFHRCGSLMLACGKRGEGILQKKYQQGLQNGVPALRLLSGDEAREFEPGLAPAVTAALFAPTAGTVNPWELGIAACENALQNGAALYRNTRVTGIRRERNGYLVETSEDAISCRAVVNAAGLAADRVHELLFPPAVRLRVNAGDYLLLDRAAAGKPAHILQYEPEDGGKGLNAVPTVEGALLLGPSERESAEGYATTEEGLSFVREQARFLLPGLDLGGTIHSFAALRPNPEAPDGRRIHSFPIEHPAPGFLSFIGIKTPGLSCARELGAYAAALLAGELHAEADPDFDPRRPAPPRLSRLCWEERAALAAREPDYGVILCACEDVSLGEVREAVRRGAVSLDGVKRRTGALMGRCQGGRCEGKLAAALADALGVSVDALCKGGPGSSFLGGENGTH